MDDSTVLGTTLLADERVPTITGKSFLPKLWIVCAGKKTQVRIDLGTILDTQTRSFENADSYGWSSGHAIRLRLDQEKPIAHFGTPSTDGNSVFLRNPIPLVKKMIGKTTLLVEYTPIASGSRTVGFTITGVGEAIADARKACKW